MLAKFKLPNAEVWKTFPPFDTPVPPSPFENEFLNKIYYASMNVTTPLTIAIIYFTSVHFINSIIRNKQIAKYNSKTSSESKVDITKLDDKKLYQRFLTQLLKLQFSNYLFFYIMFSYVYIQFGHF